MEIVFAATQDSLVQHGHYSYTDKGLWNMDISNEHEKMIRSTPRKMHRLIIQTKRK